MTRRSFLKSLIALGFASVGVSTYDTLNVELKVVKVPLNLGIRIGILTDAHLHVWGPWERRLRSLIKEMSKSLDLVVVLGDMYDSATPDLGLLEDLISLEKPALGVLGNHELWSDEQGPHRLSDGLKAYERAGVRVLRNEVTHFRGVRIGGIDWLYSLKDPGSVISDIGEVDVLLSHTPDVVAYSPKAKLILSGHTHGGQICLPTGIPIFVPSRFGTRYASGLHKVSSSYLYVSRGLGESYVLPMRTFCPRELTIVEV